MEQAPSNTDAPQGEASGHIPIWVIYVVFLTSGFSALMYQMIWQRKLFTIYGTNLESITVVVTAFMLGLGIGSLIGGVISKRPNISVLVLFGLIEAGIGLYGLVSLSLFDWIANYTLGISTAQTGLVAFGLVLVPTLLMGATLPLLVAHFVRQTSNVGDSVGRLYFINTLGAAAGSFAAVTFALGNLGLSGSVIMAAVLNLGAAATILGFGFITRDRGQEEVTA